MAEEKCQMMKIVCLDEHFCRLPIFSILHEYVGYNDTTPAEVLDRVRDATIIITTRVPITEVTLRECSSDLKLIAVMAAGYDKIDIAACRRRGIAVCNIPSASAESVAEHAIALYFAVKRKVVEMHAFTLDGTEWLNCKTAIHRFSVMPRTCGFETLGVIGYGILGKRIEKMAIALGMSVLIAERKSTAGTVRPGRTAFTDVLNLSTVIVLCCPLDKSTRNMIGDLEFALMNPSCIIINVARGGIVMENALAKALQEQRIAGAATDVFDVEPATATSSPLIRQDVPNLTLSPHVAWYANSSVKNLQMMMKLNIEDFVNKKPRNLV